MWQTGQCSSVKETRRMGENAAQLSSFSNQHFSSNFPSFSIQPRLQYFVQIDSEAIANESPSHHLNSL